MMKKIFLTLFFIAAFAANALGAQITVEEVTIPNWTFGGATATIRINPNKTFVSSNSETIPVGSVSSFYKTINCTVSGTTVSCPSFTIASTLDSSDPTARYTAYLYDSRNAMRLIYFSNFRVPSSPTTTTWAALRTYNASAEVILPSSYYTADQVNSLFSSYYSANVINTMLAGVLSNQTANKIYASPAGSTGAPGFRSLVAADIPVLDAGKITTGTFSTPFIANDAVTFDKLQNISTNKLLGRSTASSGNVEEITLGDNLTLTGGILSATGGVAYEAIVSNYAGFASAVASIAADPAVLVINEAKTCSSAITIPATLQIKFAAGATLTETGTCTITFEGGGLLDAPRTQIFSGFEPGDIKFTGPYPDVIYPEWFGVKTNNPSAAAANSAAVQTMLDSFKSGQTDNLGGNYPYYAKGAVVTFTKANYYFNTGLIVNAKVIMRGVPGTQLKFGENTWGIRINGDFTKDEGEDASGARSSGADSVFEELEMYGQPGANTHNISVSGLTVTRNSGANFDVGYGFDDGYTFTYNNFNYAIKTVDSTNQITLRPYRLRLNKQDGETNVFWLSWDLPAASPDWLGATVMFPDGNERTITNVSGHHLTFDGAEPMNEYGRPATNFEAGITVLPSANFTNINVRFNRWSGLDVRARIIVRDLNIVNFPGHGLEAHSNRLPSTAPSSQPNQNMSRITGLRAGFNMGAGIYTQGFNANAMIIEGYDTGNNTFGIFDSAFHPNVYLGGHSSADRQGLIIGGDVQGALMLKPYIEGGSPQIKLENRASVIGGTFNEEDEFGTGAIMTSTAGQGWTTNGMAASYRGNPISGSAGRKKIFSNLGWYPFQVFQAFGVSEWRTAPWEFVRRTKIWSLQHTNSGYYGMAYYDDEITDNYFSPYNPVYELTNSDAPEGGGQIKFPKGFYLGLLGSTQRKWSYVSSIPTSGTVSLGDIFWNNSSGAGATAPIGWIVSTAGAIGSDAVLSPFGNFSGATLAVNPPEIAAGATHEFTVTVNGATTNDVVTCNITGGTVDAGLVWSAYVSAANTATIRLANITASPVDGASRDWKCKIIN